MTTSAPSGYESGSRSYDLLHPTVQRWIWQRQWKALRNAQESAIPAILAGENDILISAATASGKTEAAFLPICSALAESSEGGGFRAVYIGPLQALINDQFGRLEEVCDDSGPGPAHVHGLTAGDLADAPTFPEVAGDIAEMIDGAVLVAHNAMFDTAMLLSEFAHTGAAPDDLPILCTLDLARQFGSGRRSLTLTDCAETEGIPLPRAIPARHGPGTSARPTSPDTRPRLSRKGMGAPPRRMGPAADALASDSLRVSALVGGHQVWGG